jgi:hypothetical protein
LFVRCVIGQIGLKEIIGGYNKVDVYETDIVVVFVLGAAVAFGQTGQQGGSAPIRRKK